MLLFLLGGIAGFLASRFVKSGSPPTPQMAIEEAQLIKADRSPRRTRPTPDGPSAPAAARARRAR